MRRWLITLTAFGLISGVAAGHPSDRISTGRLGVLHYGESDFGDATSIFGSPTSQRRIDGCVPTLIARWGRRLKMYFDGSDGDQIFAAWVRKRSVSAASGESIRFHTRKRLRVGDSEARLRRLYPNASSDRVQSGKKYQLRGQDGSAYLNAIVVRGRVRRLASGFTC